jgi:hypothetical protein
MGRFVGPSRPSRRNFSGFLSLDPVAHAQAQIDDWHRRLKAERLDVLLRVACEEMRTCCCTPASLSRFRSHVDRQLAMVYLAMKVLDRD